MPSSRSAASGSGLYENPMTLLNSVRDTSESSTDALMRALCRPLGVPSSMPAASGEYVRCRGLAFSDCVLYRPM